MLFLGVSAAPKALVNLDKRQMIAEGTAKKVTSPFDTKHKSLPQNGFQIARSSSKALQGVMKRNVSKPSFLVEKTPVKSVASGANIYGYLYFQAVMDFIPGLYELENGSYSILWKDWFYDYDYAFAYNGWYVDGKINGIFPDIAGGYLYGYYSYSVDFETGELLDYADLIYDTNQFFIIATLNSSDNKIYGYAIDLNYDNGNTLFWGYADASNPADVTLVETDQSQVCYSLTYNPINGKFYGVNMAQQFVEIATDGTQTVIAEVPDAEKCGTYTTGLVYSPTDGVFYWNSNWVDEYGMGSFLYTITPSGEFTMVDSYLLAEEFSYFITPDEPVAADAPKRPEAVGVNFVDGALTGDVTFKLPTTFGDGSNLPAQINYTATLNNESYKTGTGAPGSEIEVSYTVTESGSYTFGLYVTVNDKNSSAASIRAYVGNDTPVAPQKVELTETEVTWEAVTTGVNKGYIDASAVTYDVYLNGVKLGNTSSTSYSVESYFEGDLELDSFVASVVSICNGLESEPGKSNSIVAGNALNLPLFMPPTESQFALMTVEDVNPNLMGGSWLWNEADDIPFVQIGYGMVGYGQVDSYLFLPPVNIPDASKYYSFSFLSSLRSSMYNLEYLEVVIATEPSSEAVIGTIIDPFQVSGLAAEENWEEESGLLQVPAAGTYYIGIHCISEEDQLGVMVRDFSLESSNVSPESPDVAQNVTAVAGANGELKATVTFDFPTKALDGSTLAPELMLTALVTVNGGNEVVTATGKPGSQGSVTVNTVQGNNTVTVVISDGEMDSPKAQTSVYTGVSIPAAPDANTVVYEISSDMMSATLTWEAVTESEKEGGYVDPAGITYTISEYVDLIPGWGWYVWMPIEEGITTTSYTYTLPAGSPQDSYILGIQASNVAGTSSEYVSLQLQMGSIYTLPLVENLDNDSDDTYFNVTPWLQYNSFNGVTYNGTWGISEISYLAELLGVPYTGDENYIILGYSADESPAKGMMGMPRFSTMGCEEVEATFEFLTLYPAKTTIYGYAYGEEDVVEIGTCTPPSKDDLSFAEYTFTLPESLTNKSWVQILIEADYVDGDEYFGLGSVEVMSGSTKLMALQSHSAITTDKNAIIVRGLQGSSVVIATMDGKVVAKGVSNSDITSFKVEKGTYVVKAGNKSAKVVVR